ncbi:MAG: LysM peptidoglycan-binding domain-containing protein [Cyclobacteriaceae bacterium]|nr:LysM peptidoglycan-binding domain-containing protein [Cyclobacteriaceae bacterium]MCH8516790.1 LysM peptidoglycan-binding domain-containing protein [Cyclobacteriaceae bacterium]
MRHLFSCLFCFFISLSYLNGQTVEVPRQISFAGMKLDISKKAQEEIQKDVDALLRSEKYFKIKLDRVDYFMPVIERILAEEGLPNDFKYLVIQESAMISDAVSSSNAVGFWQFKKGSGEEVGLRIDNQVDERKNIHSSTRGAAKYLMTNYKTFDNWVYALLAYNTGRGGAQRLVEDKYRGVNRMPIDHNTHWYIKKFLAHLVAFENRIYENVRPERQLAEFLIRDGGSVREIVQSYQLDRETFIEENKWILKSGIPSDKAYYISYPVIKNEPAHLISYIVVRPESAPALERPLLATDRQMPVPEQQAVDLQRSNPEDFPVLSEARSTEPGAPLLLKANRKDAILAETGSTIASLAAAGNITVDDFKKYNDWDQAESIKEGQVYYLTSKRNRARIYYHTVMPDESLHDISQKYGVKIRSIRRKNRMRSDEEVRVGRVLWMRFRRPRTFPIEHKKAIRKTSPKEEIPSTVVDVKPEEKKLEHDDFEESSSDSIVFNAIDLEKYKKSPPKQWEEVLEESDSTELEKDNDFLDYETVFKVEKDTTQDKRKKDKNWIDEEIEFINYEEKDNKNLPSDKTADIEKEKAKDLEEGDNFEKILHKVMAGETLYKISREYNVDISDILKWNKKEDFNIKEGEELILYIPSE